LSPSGRHGVNGNRGAPRGPGRSEAPAAVAIPTRRGIRGRMAAMAVKALYALGNGFLGFHRAGLFYGEVSGEPVQIPVACWLVRTTEGTILFDTGLSPRAVPGLLRKDPLARFGAEDLLVHRLDAIGLEPTDIDVVVLSHLHYDHAGGAELFPKSELVVQEDEYAYAHHPAPFFASFYYRKNFDLPGYRWRLLDGDAELAPGVTALRTDGHTPGHQSLLVELPETGPVVLAADACYWREHVERELVPGVVWNPTLALHAVKRLKTLARLLGARIFPGHDPAFWATATKSPDFYR
jgi:N-acyl homoserine lactone hydrolase